MATTYITFGEVAPAPYANVFFGNTAIGEALTTSGTSAASVTVASGDSIAQVYNASAGVRVTTDVAPTASATVGVYVPAATLGEVFVRRGHKLGIIEI